MGKVLSLAKSVRHDNPGKKSYWVTRGERLLCEVTLPNGYSNILLTLPSRKKKNCLVHRLVALAFLANPEDLPCVNHKDFDKSNNAVSNLEWCSYLANAQHAIAGGRFRSPIVSESARNKISKSKMKPVRQLDMSGHQIRLWEGALVAARALGLTKSGISNCVTGRTKSCGGYKWEFA